MRFSAKIHMRFQTQNSEFGQNFVTLLIEHLRSERCVLRRSRRELSNGASLAEFGIDTAENEPSEVWPACLRPSPGSNE